jgi:hypothetical protein
MMVADTQAGDAVERLLELARDSRYSSEAVGFFVRNNVEALASRASALDEAGEALRVTTRALEIVDETMIELGFGRSDNLATAATMGRAALAKIKEAGNAADAR